MAIFTVQYSVMRNDPVPTTWPEYCKTVKASNRKEAIKKVNKQKNQRGSNPWMILDCYENMPCPVCEGKGSLLVKYLGKWED